MITEIRHSKIQNILFFILILLVEYHFIAFFMAGLSTFVKIGLTVIIGFLLYSLRENLIISLPVLREKNFIILWIISHACLISLHILYAISAGLLSWQLSLNIEAAAIATSAPVKQAQLQLQIEQATLENLTATQNREDLVATVANIANIEAEIANQTQNARAKLNAFWATRHDNGMTYQSLATVKNGRCSPIGLYTTSGTAVCNSFLALTQQLGFNDATEKLQHATDARATLLAIQQQELKVLEMQKNLVAIKTTTNAVASKSMGSLDIMAYWINTAVGLFGVKIQVTGQEVAAGIITILLLIAYFAFFVHMIINPTKTTPPSPNNGERRATHHATQQAVDNTACNTFSPPPVQHFSDSVQQFSTPMQQALQQELPRVQQPLFNVATPQKKQASPTTIMIGTNESGEGERVYFDPMAGHTLIAGQSGGGKSTFSLNTLIFQIVEKFPNYVDLYLFDSKSILPQYKGLTPNIKAACNDTEAIRYLSKIEQERQRRQNLFTEMGIIDNLTQYNIELVKQGKTPLPSILIIFDEYGIANKGVVKFIETIAKAGRSAGIFLLLMYQYDISKTGKERLSSDLLANLPQKFCFKLDKNIQYSTVTGLQHSAIKDLIKADIMPSYHCLAIIKSIDKPILLKPTLYVDDSRDKKIEWILKINPHFNISQQPIDDVSISTPFTRRDDVRSEQIEEMKAAGLNMTGIAQALGVNRTTAYRRLNELKEASNE